MHLCKYSFVFKTSLKMTMVFSLLLVIIFSSCEYEPTGTNFNEIQIDEPVIYITLENQSDTVLVSGKTKIRFHIDLEGRTLKSLKIILDSSVVFNSLNHEGEFIIYSEDFYNGLHKLRIEIISSSGTGSLGDLLDVEHLNVYYEWPILVDNFPPKPISINKVEKIDGKIKIFWQSYKKNDFQYYSLSKGYLNDKGYPRFTWIKRIFDADDTTYIDSSYIGGIYGYRIDLMAGDKESSGNLKVLSEESPKFIAYELEGENKVKLKWTKSGYEQNFHHYKVRNNFSYQTDLYDVNDTSINYENGFFGSDLEFNLSVYGNNSSLVNSDILQIQLDNKIMSYHKILFSSFYNSIYLLSREGSGFGHKLYRINPANLQILAETEPILGRELALSPDGEKLFSVVEGALVKFDPNNLEIQKTYNYPIGIPERSYPSFLEVSNNERAVFYNSTYTNNPDVRYYDSLYYFDTIKNKLFIFGKSSWIDANVEISPNGDRIIARDVLFSVLDDRVKELKEMGTDKSHYFMEDNQRIISIGSNVSIWNINGSSVLNNYNYEKMNSSFALSGGEKYIYGVWDNSIYIYEIGKSHPLKIIKTLDSNISLINNFIFSSKGFYLKLDFN